MRKIYLAVLTASIFAWFAMATSVSSGAEWPHRRLVGRFVCRGNFPLETVEPLLTSLGELQADLMADLGVPAAEKWIELYLFRDKPTYLGYLEKHFPSVPYRRALYMQSQGQGRVLAYAGPEIETDVRHECTHALLHAVLPAVPLWLDEGLAEYYEAPRASRKQDRRRPWAGVIQPPLPTLETLEKRQDVGDMGLDDYYAAWTWAYFLLHGPAEVRNELPRFLGDLRAHAPPGPMSARLRAQWPDFEQRFAAFRRGE